LFLRPSGGPTGTNILRTLTESTGGWYSQSQNYASLTVSAKFVSHKLGIVGPVVVLAPDPLESTNNLQASGGGAVATGAGINASSSLAPPGSTSPPANGSPQSQQLPHPPIPPLSLGPGALQPPTGQALVATIAQSSAPYVPPSSAVRAMLCMRGQMQGAGTWPIPESFWLERSMDILPRREAQPTLFYRRLPGDSADPALTCIDVSA